MSGTARKFGNFRDKGVILIAPVDDDSCWSLLAVDLILCNHTNLFHLIMLRFSVALRVLRD